jgi:hypothetical protein
LGVGSWLLAVGNGQFSPASGISYDEIDVPRDRGTPTVADRDWPQKPEHRQSRRNDESSTCSDGRLPVRR